jgi:hypothetical protein
MEAPLIHQVEEQIYSVISVGESAGKIVFCWWNKRFSMPLNIFGRLKPGGGEKDLPPGREKYLVEGERSQKW